MAPIMTLKLLVDKKKSRVIFAEAGKQFVDVLVHIFTLPLGTVTKLLSEEFMVGSLGRLYASVRSLSHIYVYSDLVKSDLLDPKTHVIGNAAEFTLSILPTTPASSAPATQQSVYYCSNRSNILCPKYCTQIPGTVCPSCEDKLSRKMTLIPTPTNEAEKRIGYVKEETTFMVKDDLEVTPMSGISSVLLLNEFGLKDLDDLEERNVYVGTPEGLMILKASLHSKTVLTDVFLLKKPQVPNDIVDDEEDEDYEYPDTDNDDGDGGDDDDDHNSYDNDDYGNEDDDESMMNS